MKIRYFRSGLTVLICVVLTSVNGTLAANNPERFSVGDITFMPPDSPDWKYFDLSEPDNRLWTVEKRTSLSDPRADPGNPPFLSLEGNLSVYINECQEYTDVPDFRQPRDYLAGMIRRFNVVNPEIKSLSIGGYQGFSGCGLEDPVKITDPEMIAFNSKANILTYHYIYCGISAADNPLRIHAMMRCKWSGLVGPWNTQTQQYSFLDVHFGREQAAKQLEEQKRIIERVVESMQSSSQQFKLKLEPTGGTANPLLFTIHLQTEAADGHPAEPVPETAIDLFIYDRANNHLKLKPEFHANGKLIDARSYNQKIPLRTDSRGRVDLSFLLDFEQIAKNAWVAEGIWFPGDPKALDVPVHVEFNKSGQAQNVSHASLDARLSIHHVAYMEAASFREPEVLPNPAVPGTPGDKVLPVRKGRLQDYEDHLGMKRVQIIERGSNQISTPAIPGQVFRIGDTLIIDSSKMCAYAAPDMPRSNTNPYGKIGVCLRFLDGVQCYVIVPESAGQCRIEMQKTACDTGFEYTYTQILKIIGKEGVQLGIQYALPGVGPIFLIENVLDLTGSVLGLKPIMVRLNSRIVIEVLDDCRQSITVREGSPVIYNEINRAKGNTVNAGLTAVIQKDSEITITTTDAGQAAAADMLLEELEIWSHPTDRPFSDSSRPSGFDTKEHAKKPTDQPGKAEIRTEESNAELRAAFDAYQKAFDRYTTLVTQEVEGDVEAALKEYREAYERYKAIEARESH